MLNSHYHYFIFVLFVPTPALSGSGMYFGADSISHKLETKVEVNQTFSSPPPEDINVSNSVTNDFTDPGIRIGYKYKRRHNHLVYLSPELMISHLDEDIIYGTNLKFGMESNDFSIYGVGGISHINQFDKNQFNYGLGVEYKIASRISLNLEWQKFETINEDTTAVQSFGTQVLTTTTETQRNITAIKIGITVYLHE